jgi:hypothetical protein
MVVSDASFRIIQPIPDIYRRKPKALRSLSTKSNPKQTPLQNAKTPGLLLSDNTLQNRNLNGKLVIIRMDLLLL